MPRNETIINVFVVSPSDVLEERKALESVVLELNKIWSKSLSLRLDLIKWETDVYPGFGDYSQDVINKQINDEYDIVIAIFWSKIGTATPAADSGSIEELNRAIVKHASDPKSLDIMVYFKDEAIPPSKMDFNQLQHLQNLKEQLGEKGGLYWTFDSTEDFISLLRSHLSKVAQKWSESMLSKFHAEAKELQIFESTWTQEIQQVLDEDSENGLLDYLETIEELTSEMTNSLHYVGEATEIVSKQFVRRTEELNTIDSSSGQFDVKRAKKIVKSSSEDMDKYAEVLENQKQICKQSREKVFDALSKAIALQVDFSVDNHSNDLHDLEQSLSVMRDATLSSNEMLLEFRAVVAGFPRLSITLNKSKRRVVKALDGFYEEIKATAESAQNVIDIIADIKD